MSEQKPAASIALASRPELQAIVSLASAGKLELAMAAASAIADSDVASEAWRLVSAANANLQRWDEAFSAIENALRLAPDSQQLKFARASLLEQRGDDPAALAELESLARTGADSPPLLVSLGALLASAGRADEADALLVRGLARWPAEAALHTQLARLRWQRGAGLDAVRHIEDAIRELPDALHLRLVAADLLRNAGHAARALELLGHGLARAPDSPIFRTSIGVLLEGLDRLDEALPYLRDAHARAPGSVAVRRNLVPALLRTGAAAEARMLLEGLLAQFPHDQLLIAQRATALRLLGDAGYAPLYDYPRLVKSFALVPPAPYADIGAFNRAFAQELAPLHRASRHPLEQSLRGGSQTERHLPRDNPVFATFFAMLDAPIRAYLASFDPRAPHPVDARQLGGYRISGSWSVKLQPGGMHLNHVHPRGWLSSAYYIALPEADAGEPHAGWLKFGEPGVRIAGCGPEHFVKPAEGMLVLFPSYLWHGTVPFASGARLTAAFDVVPAPG
jgi:tetratricopeptide (TPR) repeat protein